MGFMLVVNVIFFFLVKIYFFLVVYVVVFGCFDGSLVVMFGMGILYIVGERFVGCVFGNFCFVVVIGNVFGFFVVG